MRDIAQDAGEFTSMRDNHLTYRNTMALKSYLTGLQGLLVLLADHANNLKNNYVSGLLIIKNDQGPAGLG